MIEHIENAWSEYLQSWENCRKGGAFEIFRFEIMGRYSFEASVKRVSGQDDIEFEWDGDTCCTINRAIVLRKR